MTVRALTRPPVIVSIQSQVVYGCAGNAAAVPVLLASGATVHAVPTVLLSNTPHYPTVGGAPLPVPLVADVLRVFLDRVPPERIDAIVTGYIGCAGTAEAAAAFVDRVREDHPDVVYLCDPVLGDLDLGMFVDGEVAAAQREVLVPRADVLTPNLFEARYVLGESAATGVHCAGELVRRGASVAVVTGIPDAGGSRVATVAESRQGRWSLTTPFVDVRPTGTGDVFSASFLCSLLATGQVEPALEGAVNLVRGLLERCMADGAGELDVTRLPRHVEPGCGPAPRAIEA